MEEEIARTIASKLRVRLSDPQQQQIAKRASQNPEAYELYLNGLFQFRKPGFEGIKKSLNFFNHAVELDPDFALALRWLRSRCLCGKQLT